MKRHLIVAMGLLCCAAPAFAQPMAQPIPYQSKLGQADCGPVLCGDAKASPKPCQTDEQCPYPKNVPMGGLPYICLTDAQVCGWKNLNAGTPLK